MACRSGLQLLHLRLTFHFMTPSQWLANNSNTELLKMLKDKHLRLGSTFTADSIVQFRRL